LTDADLPAGAGPNRADPGGVEGEPLAGDPADDRARLLALQARVVELEAVVHRAGDSSDPGLDDPFGGGAWPPPEEPDEAPAPAAAVKAPTYEALAEFVKEEFCPRYTRRRQGGRWRWCPQWWEHSEAVSRLGALHLAWEAMHDDGPNGMGDWYRDHLDHQLPILMGADGPFRGCAEQHWPADPADDLRPGTPPADNIVWRTATPASS